MIFMVFAGLVSVIDSHLSSASSIAGHDVKSLSGNDSEQGSVTWARGGMLAAAVAGFAIANWPGMSLLTIFLFFAVLRATVWWPMMLHLWRPGLINSTGAFWGILIAFLIGQPIYHWGLSFGGGKEMVMAGTLFAVFGSAVLTVLISRFTRGSAR